MSQNTLRYLTPNDWILIGNSAKQVKFGLGEEIVAQGARLDFVYIIRHGSAAVELNGSRSKLVLAVLEKGDVCGEMGFVQQGVASASVFAQSDVEADEVGCTGPEAAHRHVLGIAARLYHLVAAILAQRLVHTSAELMRLKRR